MANNCNCLTELACFQLLKTKTTGFTPNPYSLCQTKPRQRQRKWHLSIVALIFWDNLWNSKKIYDYCKLFLHHQELLVEKFARKIQKKKLGTWYRMKKQELEEKRWDSRHSKVRYRLSQNILVGNIQAVSKIWVNCDEESGTKIKPMSQRKGATAVQTSVV